MAKDSVADRLDATEHAKHPLKNCNTIIQDQPLVGRTLYIRGPNNDPVLMKVDSITIDPSRKIPVAHLFKCVDSHNQDNNLHETREDVNDLSAVTMSTQALNRQLSHESSSSDLTIVNLLRHETKPDGIIVLTEWNSGEHIWTPLKHLCDHDIQKVIEYAEDNNLTETQGWKWVRRTKRQLARESKRLRRLVSHVQTNVISRRLRNSRSPRTIKYDIEVPRSTRDAILLDQRNNNKQWHNAIQKELGTMAQYKVFEKRHRKTMSKNFKYIPLHFVYDVKSDGTRKARLVAGGNVIKSPEL